MNNNKLMLSLKDKYSTRGGWKVLDDFVYLVDYNNSATTLYECDLRIGLNNLRTDAQCSVGNLFHGTYSNTTYDYMMQLITNLEGGGDGVTLSSNDCVSLKDYCTSNVHTYKHAYKENVDKDAKAFEQFTNEEFTDGPIPSDRSIKATTSYYNGNTDTRGGQDLRVTYRISSRNWSNLVGGYTCVKIKLPDTIKGHNNGGPELSLKPYYKVIERDEQGRNFLIQYSTDVPVNDSGEKLILYKNKIIYTVQQALKDIICKDE